MSREINCKAVLKDNAISCSASLGQTVIVTEGTEKYTPAPITPSESQQTIPTKDKQLTADVVVNPIPSEYVIPTGTETISITENGTVSRDISDKENVTVNVNVQNEDYDNALVAFGVESDLADGITALTEYSNEITGEQDETLSDAVRTLADGYNPNGVSIDEIASGTGISGDITINVETIARAYVFAGMPITSVNAPNLITIGTYNTIGGARGGAFASCNQLATFNAPKIKDISAEVFSNTTALQSFPFDNVETIGNSAFWGSGLTGDVILPKTKSVGNTGFRDAKMSTVKFGTKSTIGTGAFQACRNLTDIYVPWSQGEVANAPWGAANATIHYNTVYDSDWNVVSST